VAVTFSCDNPKSTTICQKELSELGEISIYKTVEQLANTLHISSEDFHILENNGRSINGVSLYCKDKGTINFYFDDTTHIRDAVKDKSSAVAKIKTQTIKSAEWTDSKEKKVTVKAITIY
jgi:hypothetical protein